METSEKILVGISDHEKGAYLSAIASLATADMQASGMELEYLTDLCEAADLSPAQQQMVLNTAKETNDEDLIRSLDILKTSDLKYSLVTDLLAFAKSDGTYNETEQQSVQKIANYLGVDQKQFELLGQVAEKTNATAASEEPASEQGMLSAFGLGDKLKQSGINSGGLFKGLISMAAPFILGRMMSRNRSSSGGLGGMLGGGGGLGGLLGGNTGGGMFGGGGGGMLGGGGGMFGGGGGMLGGGGGIGSLIGMLSGGRGMGASGGLLGRLFR